MICGIDPGANGGIAFLDKGKVVDLFIMPVSDGELDLSKLRKILSDPRPKHVYLEHVHAIYGCGAGSTFKFGRIFGKTEATVGVLGIPYTLVYPKKWQSLCHGGLDRKMSAKERSLIAASNIFPGTDFRKSTRARKPHDGLVDAALIAYYGYENEKTKA